MNTGRERPDPDELLRRVQAAEQRARRGRLEVFFGFAPGVGKTYRMLQAAHKGNALAEGASVVALSYIAAQRVFPDYGDMDRRGG